MTTVSETKNVRVTVSMPQSQVDRMVRCAESLGLSRNAFMQVAIGEYINNKELLNEQLIATVIEQIITNKGEK